MMERLNGQRAIRFGIGILLAAVPLILFVVAQVYSTSPEVVWAAPLYDASAGGIRFNTASDTVREGDGTVFVVIRNTITPTLNVVVNLVQATSPLNTATRPSDFIISTGVITIPAGTAPTTFDFEITIVDDTVYEGPDDEVAILQLVIASGDLGLEQPAFFTMTIEDNEPAPTVTPTATTGAPPVFLDGYEPNNSLGESFLTAANAALLCDITLWPTGDEDYFSFWGRKGLFYIIFTEQLDPGIDTFMRVYNAQGNEIGSNDDISVGKRASQVSFKANADGFYYAQIVNQDPTDPTNKTYCFGVDEIVPPTATPTRTPQPAGGDACEFNSTLETACLIGAGETKSLNFTPSYGSPQDTDMFKLWVKPGIFYTCETLNLSSVNDTNIILIDGNGNYFNPPIGNDDKAPGNLGSKVSYLSTYTGWLYIEVGPVNPPLYEESGLYTYDLTCQALVATPTATFVPRLPSSGTGGTTAATPTPFVFPTFPPSPTPIDLSLFATPTPAAPPQVQFQPLPTATPATSGQQISSVSVTLYYDDNRNFTPEATEGIVDVAIALYDNATGQLIQFGHTNEAGVLNFGSIAVAGAVRIEVPFLGYSQIIVGANNNILLRIAPQPLPDSIP